MTNPYALVDCRVCHKLARGSRDTRVCMNCIDGIYQSSHCPECDSDVTLVVLTTGVMTLNVAHDDTCPWRAELERNGGLGVRFGYRQ